MNSLLTLKKWTKSKPYIWLFIMVFCFIFFLVFNFGLDTFKKSRGLASSEDSPVNKEMSKVVVNNISTVIEGRAVQHGAEPSAQEQFMYGYLQGKYKAVYRNDKFSYIELKKNHQPLTFSKNRRQELMNNVQALFIPPGTTLENMKSTRQPASTSFFYEMKHRGELKGRFKMIFSDDQELISIGVSELSL